MVDLSLMHRAAAAGGDGRALAGFACALATARDLGNMADLLAGTAARQLKLAAAVALRVPGAAAPCELPVVACHGFWRPALNHWILRVDAGPGADAWSCRQTREASAAAMAPSGAAADLAETGARRLLLVPMPGHDGPHGLLLLGSLSPRRFSDATVARAELLAAQAALAAAALGSTEAFSETAAACAHEVRNALVELRGHLQLAAAAPERAAPRLGAALAAVDRVSWLAGDLLTLSRPVVVRPEPVHLAELAESVLAACDTAGVQVQRRYDPLGPVVAADPSRLRQVVYNLLSNALAAMGGRGTLALGTGREAGGAWIAVADDGPGIPPEYLPRLFTPFFTTRPGGSGLGLAVCRRLAEAHGGRIEVSSAAGGGAAFVVHLPAGQDSPCDQGEY